MAACFQFIEGIFDMDQLEVSLRSLLQQKRHPVAPSCMTFAAPQQERCLLIRLEILALRARHTRRVPGGGGTAD